MHNLYCKKFLIFNIMFKLTLCHRKYYFVKLYIQIVTMTTNHLVLFHDFTAVFVYGLNIYITTWLQYTIIFQYLLECVVGWLMLYISTLTTPLDINMSLCLPKFIGCIINQWFNICFMFLLGICFIVACCCLL